MQTGSASRFSAIRDKTSALLGARLDSRLLTNRAASDRYSPRQGVNHTAVDRFTAIRIATVVIAASRFDVRSIATNAGADRFSARFSTAHTSSDRFSARFPTGSMKIDRFSIRHATAVIGKAWHNAYVPYGWTLFARNADTGAVVELGFIKADADPKTLTDVPLADGVWEIEARPSQWFWDNCRGRKIVTLVAGKTATDGEPMQGLPAIQDLRREIVSGRSVIRWKVALEYEPESFRFGLWFGITSPVDTSGDPDIVVNYYFGYGDYAAVHAQSEAEYVAVAAFSDDDTGPVTELELPWDTSAPAVPPNQSALDGGRYVR